MQEWLHSSKDKAQFYVLKPSKVNCLKIVCVIFKLASYHGYTLLLRNIYCECDHNICDTHPQKLSAAFSENIRLNM